MGPRSQHRLATVVAATLVGLVVAAAPQPAMAQRGAGAGQAGGAPAPAAPLPRTSDGHPDLSGMWVRAAAPDAGPTGPNIPAFGLAAIPGQDDTVWSTRDRNLDYAELDQEFINKMGGEFPIYKPEYWAVIQYNDEVGYEHPRDPAFGCRNPGIVRLGSPTEIVQLPHKVILLYPGSTVWMRQVPIGAKLRTEDEYESIYTMGVPVGRWEGDTLVVETVDFIPDGAWYTGRGLFQSATSKVTERFTPTPEGGITYQATIDDPALLKPWVRPAVNMRRNPNPAALFATPLPCVENDGPNITMEHGEAVEAKSSR